MSMVEMVLQRMYFICVVCIHKIQMLAEHRLFLTASQSKAKQSDCSKIAPWHNISIRCVYVCLKSFPVLIKEHKEKKCFIFYLCFCMCVRSFHSFLPMCFLPVQYLLSCLWSLLFLNEYHLINVDLMVACCCDQSFRNTDFILLRD